MTTEPVETAAWIRNLRAHDVSFVPGTDHRPRFLRQTLAQIRGELAGWDVPAEIIVAGGGAAPVWIERWQTAAARAGSTNEDISGCLAVPVYDRKFRLPSEREAMYFAVERKPIRHLAHLTGRLPFGCHAWRRHGFEVWTHHLRAAG